MKKLFALMLTLGLITTHTAQASQARLLALGMDKLDNEGSYYIDDPRNIFLNAANAYDYGNMAFFEWGDNGRVLGGPSAGEASIWSEVDPKAQGGFLQRVGDYVFGLYYGNESNTASFLRIAATSNAAALNGFTGAPASLNPLMLPTADNQLDLFLAGRTATDLRWGVNLVYLNNEDKSDDLEQTDKAGAIRLGLKSDRWQAHANISFMNEAKNTVDADSALFTGDDKLIQEFDGKLGLHLGGSYDLNGRDTLYAYVKTFKWDQKDSYEDYDSFATAIEDRVGKEGTNKGEFTQFNLGWGHEHQMDNGGTYFVNVFFRKTDVELNLAEKIEVSQTRVPVTFGYEYAATQWLTLRGSITQTVYGKRDNKNFDSANIILAGAGGQPGLLESTFGPEGKGSLMNTTEVRAGASLVFGNLHIDGLLGIEKDGNNVVRSDKLNINNLLSTVAVTYSF